jgi:hypothetical protein
MAAAKGMLPLTNQEQLEVIVLLLSDTDAEVRESCVSTLGALDLSTIIDIPTNEAAPAEVLGFLCVWERSTPEILEAAVFNPSTPDAALIHLAGQTTDPGVIESISLRQQSMIRTPEIIDAILANPARTIEAERRALEIRNEFFEKEFGARIVAEEHRARQEAAAEVISAPTITVNSIEDLVSLGLIEPASDADNAIIAEYEAEFGPFESTPPAQFEQIDMDALMATFHPEELQVAPDRLPVFQQIAIMSIKDRVLLGIRGTREARLILIRDPNRIVASSVMRNPRITEQEIEQVASIRTVPEEVLRQIGQSRAWTRSYTVVHALVRNPRTPIAISLGLLGRIQTKDLRILSTNKNIPDVIRTSAGRLYLKRSGGASG